MIQCFFLEPTDRIVLGLRRFTGPGCHGAGAPAYDPGKPASHTGSKRLGIFPIRYETRDGRQSLASRDEEYAIPDEDERWPQKCDFCDHRFLGFPFIRVVDQDPIYRRTDTGEEMSLKDAPAGALWYADWYHDTWQGPDGHTLVCKVPGGKSLKHDWIIDGPANNCPIPEDHEHRCWVRSGIPPKVTVGKTGGKTCGAGGGSISVPGYHGFLRDGFLVPA